MEDEKVSMTLFDYEAPAYDSDCESSVSGPRQLTGFAGNGIVRLEDETEGSEYSVIKRSLIVGMGLIGKDIDVVAVHKNSYSGVTGQARLEAFRIFSRAVAAKRGGDANAKYGWYGGSRDEIRDIVTHGFGRCGSFEKGVSHGIGVNLSPANVPIESALRAKEDENGVRHMLLCRVILGNTETICPGSEQSRPSSDHFDSGIDNPLSPRKYIIWSSYMNTHIFPNYIISFRAPSLIGLGGTSNYAKKPNSASTKFPKLLKMLSRFLHPSKMGLISNYYNDFRENKIGRPQLIRRLRNIVGDKLLISVIKLCKNEVIY